MSAAINILSYIEFVRERVLDYMLPDTCTVYPVSAGSDASGGYSENLGNARTYDSSTLIPCRLDTTRQYNQLDIFSQEVVVTDYQFYLPHDFDLEVNDLIIHQDHQYQIKKLSDDNTWIDSKRAYVVLVR